MAPRLSPEDYAGTDRAIFTIDGLWCPSCAAAVERVIRQAPGVSRAQVSYASASAALIWEPGTDLAAVGARVAKLGYAMHPRQAQSETDDRIGAEMRRFGIRLAVAVVFGMWCMFIAIIGYVEPAGLSDPALARVLGLASAATALPVVGYAAVPLIRSGWRTLRAGAPGMDSLVALGILAASGASVLSLALGRSETWFDTAVMLTVLLLAARLTEMATLRRSTRAIAAVEAALPDRALRLTEGRPREVLATEVAQGDRIRVAPGDRVSLDGVIDTGHSAFDTSSLTGESLPRPLGPGDPVEAGFVNLDSPVEVTVTAAVGARRIDRMGAAVEAMLHDRPELHALADRIAGWVVPAALLLVAATVLGWSLAGLPPGEVALRALSVLVIACPCAISLAAPVSHLAAVSAASRQGLLLRRQSATETLGAVRWLVFDKTGTLTLGRPQVAGVRCLAKDVSPEAILRLAAAAEGELRHPLADAIRAAAGPAPGAAEEQTRASDGVSARVEGAAILLGSAGFLQRNGVALPAAGDGPGTRVWLARDGRALGEIRLTDALRPEAAETLAGLRARGIGLLMATGDSRDAALPVAEALGLAPAAVFAGLTPEDKVALVEGLEGPVGFVGDGLNDTAALVAADVGIAASDANPASVGVADIVIARGGLAPVGAALSLSRRARAVLRQNLGFALVYNLAALALAAEGAVPPVAAALAMTASSLTVLANASRLAAPARGDAGRGPEA